ncbi:IS200/IS605 family transposase [Moorena producens JHB]|uniref:IS200/IS605 family transposase n=1 Tax=Moorena producens (strain JHB) TaxID=1454205 RepID=A0A1D9G125_MOOP1|nr:IS200/IS605 family transposase [Moorena producens]AOY81316.1 IS200/IS605 family transposase [Moorena producens JHB]
MGQQYRHDRHSVSLVNYHIVWITKRRKKVLVDNIEKRLREIIWEVLVDLDCKLISLEIQPDHVHLFVNAYPCLSAKDVVNRVKGRSSRYLRQEFPILLRLPSLWTRSYFVSTAGNVSSETVRRYIENHREHHGA